MGFCRGSLPVRYPLAVVGVTLMASALLMKAINSSADAYLAAALFGFGVGGILTLLPVAWADYFGRAHFGAIRSVALSAQVVAQAAGPLASGALRDWTGSYQLSLSLFAVSAGSALSRRWSRGDQRRPAWPPPSCETCGD